MHFVKFVGPLTFNGVIHKNTGALLVSSAFKGLQFVCPWTMASPQKWPPRGLMTLIIRFSPFHVASSWFNEGGVTTWWSHFWLSVSLFRDWLNGTRPPFFWLVKNLIYLHRGMVACLLEFFCAIFVFITGFLISSYSFQDGVTLYFFLHDPESFILLGSVLVPFSLIFVHSPKYLILLCSEVLWLCNQTFWLKIVGKISCIW